jgi:hypothetical protein
MPGHVRLGSWKPSQMNTIPESSAANTAPPRAPAPPPFANPAPSEGFGLLHIRRLPPAITPIRFCSPWPADVVKSVVGAAGLAPIADAGGRGTRIRFCGKSRPDYAL